MTDRLSIRRRSGLQWGTPPHAATVYGRNSARLPHSHPHCLHLGRENLRQSMRPHRHRGYSQAWANMVQTWVEGPSGEDQRVQRMGVGTHPSQVARAMRASQLNPRVRPRHLTLYTCNGPSTSPPSPPPPLARSHPMCETTLHRHDLLDLLPHLASCPLRLLIGSVAAAAAPAGLKQAPSHHIGFQAPGSHHSNVAKPVPLMSV